VQGQVNAANGTQRAGGTVPHQKTQPHTLTPPNNCSDPRSSHIAKHTSRFTSFILVYPRGFGTHRGNQDTRKRRLVSGRCWIGTILTNTVAPRHSSSHSSEQSSQEPGWLLCTCCSCTRIVIGNRGVSGSTARSLPPQPVQG